jgi:cyclophilin family peptidyl-prolyl cis-trans isomerase
VRERLVAVASTALASPGPARSFAIRALGQGGDGAVPPLTKVLGDPDARPAERAEAARQLGRLGDAGQAALAEAIVSQGAAALEAKTLVGPAWAPLAASLDALESPLPAARERLAQLAEGAVPEQATPADRRRRVWVRCAAAAILAGEATRSRRLVACDPDPEGRTGALARLRVLDRGRLAGARLRLWQASALGSDAVVAETALGQMAHHPEIPRPQETLATALASEHAGVVAAAAKILSSFPDRAAAGPTEERTDPDHPLAPTDAPKPDGVIVSALTQALRKSGPAGAVEPRASLLEAAGALGVLSLKPEIEDACGSDQPVLRAHAERALHRMGDRRRTCPGAPPSNSASPPPPPAIGGFELILHTDAGKLRVALDAAVAPYAVARIVELARSGFYNGTIIHRAVPGFVVQFGDPGGDGYGGSPLGPLRCEIGTSSFDDLAVGMALAGRDTGSSQLFVTLASYPHLEGEYTRVGTASGDWDRVFVGDVIERAEVRPLATP